MCVSIAALKPEQRIIGALESHEGFVESVGVRNSECASAGSRYDRIMVAS